MRLMVWQDTDQLQEEQVRDDNAHAWCCAVSFNHVALITLHFVHTKSAGEELFKLWSPCMLDKVVALCYIVLLYT